MNITQLIAKKRDGGEYAADEIRQIVGGYVSGAVADYQMSAWAMAVFCRGMTDSETAALTDSMLQSGVVLSWPDALPPRVDKHSTGGIGDKVSLPLAPMLACCDLCVPMLSGRGLGPTGGTLDKLEAIPGYRTNLSLEEIRRQTEEVGCVITGTTPELVPADRKMYALRDVTATVPSIPLITASIMSKKLAEGLNALVLDVKFGSGAFMKTAAQARELAEKMVAVGKRMGVATTALLTDMNQPLGRLVGNAVEVSESLEVLRGRGPSDLRELTLRLGEEVLISASRARCQSDARSRLVHALDSGQALARFEQMVAAQGGRLNELCSITPASELCCQRSGIVSAIDAEALGWAIIDLGGGRRQLSDRIDPSVGLEMLVRIGDAVTAGQPWLKVFAPQGKLDGVRDRLQAAIRIADSQPELPKLVVERIA